MVGIRAGALRLLLLALLGIGVIGMHTIGHSPDHYSLADEAGHATVDEVAPPLTAMVGTCDGDCGTHGALTVWPGVGPGSDPMPGGAGLMIVCLAVLFGAGLLVLLSYALARRAGPVPRGAPSGTTRLPRTGFSFPLRLVDVAVLRI